MKGIIGCNNLIPYYKQMKRVSAVCYFYSAVPLMKSGFVAYK